MVKSSLRRRAQSTRRVGCGSECDVPGSKIAACMGLVRLRFARTWGEFHPLRGIDVDAVDVKDPVEMGASGTAGRTGVTEDVAALNLRAGSGGQLGHVEVHGLEALAVVNADSIAEHVELLSESYGTSSNGADGFAGGSALIDAAVIFTGGFAVVETFDTEGRSHTSGYGRGERVLPRTRVGDSFLEGGQQCDFFRGRMQCFNFGSEPHVLRREKCFADDDRKFLRLGAIVARDGECGRAGDVFHGNGEQSKILTV